MTEQVTQTKAVLFKKLAAVLGDVERVPKNGFNAFFKYHYATESDLVDVLRPALAKQGIAVFFSVLDTQVIPVENSRNGNITRVHIRATFGCGESGDTFDVDWYGDGQDSADKGLNKAYTAAVKYLLMKTFLVSTGDDPDADEPAQPPRPTNQSPQQQPQRPAQQQPQHQPAQQSAPNGHAQPAQPQNGHAAGAAPNGKPTPNGQQAPHANGSNGANGHAATNGQQQERPMLIQDADKSWTILIDGDKYRVPDSFKDLPSQDLTTYKGWVKRAKAAGTLGELKALFDEVEPTAAAMGSEMLAQVKAVLGARKVVVQKTTAPKPGPVRTAIQKPEPSTVRPDGEPLPEDHGE